MGIYKPGRPHKYRPDTDKGIEPPHRPGEYRIRDDQNKVIYIGESNDLKSRMYEHIHSGKLQSGYSLEYQRADGRSSSQTRRQHEREKIAQHDPKLNRSRGGEGRKAKK